MHIKEKRKKKNKKPVVLGYLEKSKNESLHKTVNVF